MQDLTQLADAELVELCRRRGVRDDRPASELFRRHHGRVWQLCYRLSGSPQDAEDLSQEVFFKAFQGLPRFAGRAAFGSWIYRIAMNACYNELRNRRRRIQPLELEPETVVTEAVEGTPESRLLAAERSRRLAGALSRLRPGEVEILRLVDLESRPYAEAATQLGLGLSATKMRLQRARLALQRAYRESEGQP